MGNNGFPSQNDADRWSAIRGRTSGRESVAKGGVRGARVWERLVRGGDDPTELDALLDAMPMPFFQD